MRVILHSNAQAAADATDRTLKMLPMSGNAHLLRDDNGKVVFDADGAAHVETTNPGFVEFALKNQGYVKQVLPN